MPHKAGGRQSWPGARGLVLGLTTANATMPGPNETWVGSEAPEGSSRWGGNDFVPPVPCAFPLGSPGCQARSGLSSVRPLSCLSHCYRVHSVECEGPRTTVWQTREALPSRDVGLGLLQPGRGRPSQQGLGAEPLVSRACWAWEGRPRPVAPWPEKAPLGPAHPCRARPQLRRHCSGRGRRRLCLRNSAVLRSR